MKKHFIAAFMIFLVLTIPFYSSSVFAVEQWRVTEKMSIQDLRDKYGVRGVDSIPIDKACFEKSAEEHWSLDLMNNQVMKIVESLFLIVYLITSTLNAISLVWRTLGFIWGYVTDGTCWHAFFTFGISESVCAFNEAGVNVFDWGTFAANHVITCLLTCPCSGLSACGISPLDMVNKYLSTWKSSGDGTIPFSLNIDAYDNIITAVGCLCLGAVLFNLRKLATIYETYNCCVAQSCALGYDVEGCEAFLDTATCMYLEGAAIKTLMKIVVSLILSYLLNLIPEEILKLFFPPIVRAALYSYQSYKSILGLIDTYKMAMKQFEGIQCDDLGYNIQKEMDRRTAPGYEPGYELGQNEDAEGLISPDTSASMLDFDGDGVWDSVQRNYDVTKVTDAKLITTIKNQADKNKKESFNKAYQLTTYEYDTLTKQFKPKTYYMTQATPGAGNNVFFDSKGDRIKAPESIKAIRASAENSVRPSSQPSASQTPPITDLKPLKGQEGYRVGILNPVEFVYDEVSWTAKYYIIEGVGQTARQKQIIIPLQQFLGDAGPSGYNKAKQLGKQLLSQTPQQVSDQRFFKALSNIGADGAITVNNVKFYYDAEKKQYYTYKQVDGKSERVNVDTQFNNAGVTDDSEANGMAWYLKDLNGRDLENIRSTVANDVTTSILKSAVTPVPTYNPINDMSKFITAKKAQAEIERLTQIQNVLNQKDASKMTENEKKEHDQLKIATTDEINRQNLVLSKVSDALVKDSILLSGALSEMVKAAGTWRTKATESANRVRDLEAQLAKFPDDKELQIKLKNEQKNLEQCNKNANDFGNQANEAKDYIAGVFKAEREKLINDRNDAYNKGESTDSIDKQIEELDKREEAIKEQADSVRPPTEAEIKEEIELAQAEAIRKQAVYSAAFATLNIVLDEFAYEWIDDFCEEKVDASVPESLEPQDDALAGINTNNLNASAVSCPSANTIGTAQLQRRLVRTDSTNSFTEERPADYPAAYVEEPPFNYRFEYSLQACKSALSYRISLVNAAGFKELKAGSLSVGNSVQNSTMLVEQQLYDYLCIQTTDASFGNNGERCFGKVTLYEAAP